MISTLHLEVSYQDGPEAKWSVGAISQWGERIELARSTEMGPFCTLQDVKAWIDGMWGAWTAPSLGTEASESLHDAFINHLV